MLPSNPRPAHSTVRRDNIRPSALGPSRNGAKEGRSGRGDTLRERRVWNVDTIQVKPQRSMGTLSSKGPNGEGDFTSAPLPKASQHNPARTAPFPFKAPARTYSSSSDSTESSVDSFLERMRSGHSSRVSSQTSLESREGVVSRRNWAKKPGPGGSSMEVSAADKNDTLEQNPDSYATYGQALWDRLTTAANQLTVNVNLAWNTTVKTFDGEVTPPGEDSHLTRVLKAYHIEKARDRSDLPDWLFNDDERRVGVSLLHTTEMIADEYALDRAPSVTKTSNANSKATNRLRELRDAKRKAAVAAGSRYNTSDKDGGDWEKGTGLEQRFTSQASREQGRSSISTQRVSFEMPPNEKSNTYTQRLGPTSSQGRRIGLPSSPRRRV